MADVGVKIENGRKIFYDPFGGRTDLGPADVPVPAVDEPPLLFTPAQAAQAAPAPARGPIPGARYNLSSNVKTSFARDFLKPTSAPTVSSPRPAMDRSVSPEVSMLSQYALPIGIGLVVVAALGGYLLLRKR